VKLGVDGRIVERIFPPTDQDVTFAGDGATMSIDLPAGAHTITLENVGTDWVQIRNFTLTNFAPALGAYALRGPRFVAAWIFHRANITSRQENRTAPANGSLSVPGLKAGRYQAVWHDTLTGQALQSAIITKIGEGPLTLKTPLIARDAALHMAPVAARR
ncbi:MAG: hypothetical protein JWN98_223, partial [Abditibacteriota bacterium]|nr:hypothetical protein [Abditibacteriota bacterium]